jgi:hypothetical protein
MQFCKETNYDGWLGGCLKVIIPRILYSIDYVLPNLNVSLGPSHKVLFNISKITYSYSFLQFRKYS